MPDQTGFCATLLAGHPVPTVAGVVLTGCPRHGGVTKGQTVTTSPTALDIARQSLAAFLAKDMKGWTDLCHDDVVAEFPFAPDGSPKRIEGRTALYAYLRGYPEMIDIADIPHSRFYRTDDPQVVILEWSVTGRVIGNGNPYNLSYATFVTVRDGLITSYREYWNPQDFLTALGGGQF